jgi:hypothetical protein
MPGTRGINIRFTKDDTKKTSESSVDEVTFEQRTEYILSSLESIGSKMFLGVCIYMLLDTHRKVSVVKAMNPSVAKSCSC